MTLSFPTRRSGDLADLTREQVEDMVRYLAIANYEDRFVIPTAHREYAENAFDLKGECGFSFGNGCSGGSSAGTVFGHKPAPATPASSEEHTSELQSLMRTSYAVLCLHKKNT